MEEHALVKKYNEVNRICISNEHFFMEFLSECFKRNLIDKELIEKIGIERMKILQTQLNYYTRNESSSVMTEKAESILDSIDYTLGIYLKSCDTIDDILEKIKNESLEYMFKCGHKMIKDDIKYSVQLLQKVKNNKLKVNNYSYEDTIEHGISIFFKVYDDFFSAHETPGSIDYQLCIDIDDYIGIEYIKHYLERINLENEFCHKFSIDDINLLLRSYDKNSELLLINIFELVMINCVGRSICGKGPENLNITYNDREIIKNKLDKLSLDELKEALINYMNISIADLKIKNDELISYIYKCINKMASLIFTNIETDTLEKVFISFNEEVEENIVQYIDSQCLSNSEFRMITSKIRSCSDFNIKLDMINKNINSLKDLNDMLDAECLFGDEYTMLFESLPQMQIIMLSKYIDEYPSDKEWHLIFRRFIDDLNEETKINIEKIKENILIG